MGKMTAKIILSKWHAEMYERTMKKANIAAAVWFVTMAILGVFSINSAPGGNIWSDSNYPLMIVFIVHGISLVYGLYQYYVSREYKYWRDSSPSED
jgi:cytochrome bd-type quinol oxidase subunit 2